MEEEDTSTSSGPGDSSSDTVHGCPSESALAGQADVCIGCPGRQLCLSQGGVDPDQKYIDIRMNAIKRKILVISGKGGVGKSSIAASLSMALGSLEKKVGLLDLDICGPSVPKLMRVEGLEVVNSQYGWEPLKSPHYNIKVMSVGSLLQEDGAQAVVWRGPRKTALIKRFMKETFWGRLDFVIFDTPPGTSDEHLTVIKTLINARPEGAIIVTTPQKMALATIRKEINFCKKMKLRVIGLVENMSGFTCSSCSECWPLFSENGAAKLAEEYDIPLLGTVPLDPNFVMCCEKGMDIFSEFPESPAAVSILKIAKRLHQQKQ